MMKAKDGVGDTPIIVVKFVGDTCEWHSAGWAYDTELRTRAIGAIIQGGTQEEVIALLDQAGFDVVEQASNGERGGG